MTRYEPPTALPRRFLEGTAVQKALAAHDFGTVFSLARTEAHISYSKIAAECGIKPERVSALARGEGSITSFEKITRIADALRIPGHMLGLAPRDWETVTYTRHEEGDELRRRDFFKASAGAGLAAGLPNLAGPAVGRRVGSSYPQRLRERAARLRRLDDILGGGDTYGVYTAEYQATKTVIRDCSYSEDTGRGLLSVLAEQAQQAGWAAFDSGRHQEAASLYRASHDAAVEAGDTALAGNAMAFLAYQVLSGDKTSGIKFAARSIAEAGAEAPPSVRALLNERLAWAYAVAQEPSETARALEAAEAALAENHDTPQPDWAAWVDHNELLIMTGRCWTELRRPLRAVPVLEEALGRYDDAHARDKSLYMSWLATSYLHADEIEQAAAITGRALDLSVGVASVRPQERLAPVLRALSRHSSLPEVAAVLGKAAIA
ncbi:helix-turn-helix transcriptional regulator [Streptomyces sp. NPDC048281]|uniref:helix-turn-helix domain-containing protein n=1 Tax=Streptomyces sp. NPDC048281 TaxID=3154715 RepID=UPI00342C2BD7